MSEKLVIFGQTPLRGKVEIRGSKNAASKMLVASLLTSEPCLIENVPLSGEVEITKELMSALGSEVHCDPDHRCQIRTKEINTAYVSEFSRKNRIPILTLGPLLHRKGYAEVPIPGGDQIGPRPINFHIEALAKMGVKIERRERSFFAKALQGEIHGAEIELPYPSVGATENVMLTAVLAAGRTVLKNAAVEPEIQCLAEMLNRMGAQINFEASSRTVAIDGVKKLSGAAASVLPDRNEAVSFAAAALATGGEVTIANADKMHLDAFVDKVREIGAEVEMKGREICFRSTHKYKKAFIETAPHPGFMTDWQQPLSILLTKALGASIIHETVYEDRFGYTADLNKMGAKIQTSLECHAKPPCRFCGQGYAHTALITGPTPLIGTRIEVTDIRAGMAHIIAALSAEGQSVISGLEHIDRGYERIDERLRALGADIKRI